MVIAITCLRKKSVLDGIAETFLMISLIRIRRKKCSYKFRTIENVSNADDSKPDFVKTIASLSDVSKPEGGWDALVDEQVL